MAPLSFSSCIVELIACDAGLHQPGLHQPPPTPMPASASGDSGDPSSALVFHLEASFEVRTGMTSNERLRFYFCRFFPPTNWLERVVRATLCSRCGPNAAFEPLGFRRRSECPLRKLFVCAATLRTPRSSHARGSKSAVARWWRTKRVLEEAIRNVS